MKRVGEMVGLGAFAAALALYALTAPEGLPWNASSHLALAYLGEIVRLPAMPHPLWGFYVQVFGGSVALAVFLAALAAGLLGSLVCRYFGWRFACGAALVWMFMPAVWNRAVTGDRGVCLASMVVVAAWVLNGVLLFVTRKARATQMSEQPKGTGEKRRRLVERLALASSGVFVLASLTMHDYRIGEAASVFARGVVQAAGERIIVLNGVCDDQIVRAVKKDAFKTISLRTDDAYRARLVAWAREAFPSETNLWVAAQVGPQAFVDAATKAFPDRFYVMNGASETPIRLAARWEAFEPYLDSGDPFVPVARRMFGYEGNAVANALLDESKGAARSRQAWQLYKRVYDEFDPKNFSALANMNEMIRRGYAASGDEKKRVRDKIETFFKDANNRQHVRRIVRAAGPIRTDVKQLEITAEKVKKEVAAKIAAGEKLTFAPEILSLVEWNNEMCAYMDKGEIIPAGRIARAILSNPKWHDFIPANAVMGSVAAYEGDYVASERFFQVAVNTTNRVSYVVLNDYADTLMRLGKLDEAEKIARQANAATDEKVWLVLLTLVEILEKKATGEAEGKNADEIRLLLKKILAQAPAKVREKVRKDYGVYLK